MAIPLVPSLYIRSEKSCTEFLKLLEITSKGFASDEPSAAPKNPRHKILSHVICTSVMGNVVAVQGHSEQDTSV